MGQICQFCGAVSKTADRCSVCGAPVESVKQEAYLPNYTVVRNAVDKHYTEAVKRGFVIKSGKNATLYTWFYIDGKPAFLIRSSNGMVGNFIAYTEHSEIAVAVTKLGRSNDFSEKDQKNTFGDDSEGVIMTISKILAAIEPTFDESRISVKSYAEHNFSPLGTTIILTVLGSLLALIVADFAEVCLLSAFLPSCLYLFFSLFTINSDGPKAKFDRITTLIAFSCMSFCGMYILSECYLSYLSEFIYNDCYYGGPYYWLHDVDAFVVSSIVYSITFAIYSFIKTYIVCRNRKWWIVILPLLTVVAMVLLYLDRGVNDAWMFYEEELFLLIGLLCVAMWAQTVILSIVNKSRVKIE